MSTLPRIAAKLGELYTILKGEFDRWCGTRNKTIDRVISFMTDVGFVIDLLEEDKDAEFGTFVLALEDRKLTVERLKQCFLERQPHAEQTRAARIRAMALMADVCSLALEDPALNP